MCVCVFALPFEETRGFLHSVRCFPIFCLFFLLLVIFIEFNDSPRVGVVTKNKMSAWCVHSHTKIHVMLHVFVFFPGGGVQF